MTGPWLDHPDFGTPLKRTIYFGLSFEQVWQALERSGVEVDPYEEEEVLRDELWQMVKTGRIKEEDL